MDLNMKIDAITESQNDQILRYMAAGNRIDVTKARRLFDCERLAARIKNLRDYGWHIRTHRKAKNGKWVAEYELEDK